MKPATMRRAGPGRLLAEMRRHMLRASRALAEMDRVYRELKRRDAELEAGWAAWQEKVEAEERAKPASDEATFRLAHRGGRR